MSDLLRIELDQATKRVLCVLFFASLVPLAVSMWLPFGLKRFVMIPFVISCACGLLLLSDYQVKGTSLIRSVRISSFKTILSTTILTIGFIAFTLLFPALYTGGYTDEYLHVVTGLELMQTGEPAEIYHAEPYVRGLHTSALVGFSMFLFGEHFYAAKLVPALLGIITFGCLWYISRRVLTNGLMVLMVLFIFATNSLLIFQHFFIRSYVLTEACLMAVLALGILMINTLRKNKLWSALACGTIIIAICYALFHWGGGYSGYPVILAGGIVLAYVFIYEIGCLKFTDNNPFGRFANVLLNSSIITKSIVVLGIFLVVSFYLGIPNRLDFLLNGQVPYGSVGGRNSFDLFFRQYPIYIVLFLLGFPLLFRKSDVYESSLSMLFAAGFVLFFFHMVISDSLQLIRGMIYLLPLIFLLAICSLENIMKNFEHWNMVLGGFAFLLILANAAAYPSDFWTRPGLIGEQEYTDYEKAYGYAADNCNNKTIVETNLMPINAALHGVKLDYNVITNTAKLGSDVYFFENERYWHAYTKIPVATAEEINIIAQKPYCYIIRITSSNRLASGEPVDRLKENATHIAEFSNMSVYVKE
jgi:hypothetical protein